MSRDLAERWDGTRASEASWHALDVEEVERRLGSPGCGLAEAEVDARLERHGPNQLAEPPPTPDWLLLLRQFESPLIYILLLASALTVLLGRSQDALVIGVVLLLNAIVGFTQERRAESSVRALMRLSAPKASALREGTVREIDSRGLVPGDRVQLEPGARVPADVRLVSSHALLIDESLLTGESLAVGKSPRAVEPSAGLADRACVAFAGSMVSSGRGLGIVVATGAGTELGRIASTMRETQRGLTPLQSRMQRFARQISVAVSIASGLAFAIGVLRGQDMLEMLLVAVALAVAAIPEALPAILTLTLSIGVKRMARRHAIVRHLGAVETLGATTVIGTDKTGTLTENRMTVVELLTMDAHLDRAALVERADGAERASICELLSTGILTNEARSERRGAELVVEGDPTEIALIQAAARAGIDPLSRRHTAALLAELPFEPERRFSAAVRARGDERVLYVKGAPEVVRARARDADMTQMDAGVASMTSRGLRVLGLASRTLAPDERVEDALARPKGLTFLGLIGLMDPPRPGVAEAIRGCATAGVRVVMMTGDHASTALSIARELELATASDRALSGPEVDTMDDEALCSELRKARVLARLEPRHKLRIVKALRDMGEVVAVTGDGVNDAPALKAASIGVAMGRCGTDVAREAADIVLADDNFATIYAAVEEGRITFDNLRKVTFFLLCTGVAEVFVVLGALALGLPLAYTPAQLLWLNLVTNGLQDLALAFEPGEKSVRCRPPREPASGILDGILWERMLIAGVVMTLGTIYVFHRAFAEGSTLEHAQTLALTVMVLFQSFQVGMARSESASVLRQNPFSNGALVVAALAALLTHAGAVYIPAMRDLLRLAPLTLREWGLLLIVSFSIVPAMELHKWVRRTSAVIRGRRAA